MVHSAGGGRVPYQDTHFNDWVSRIHNVMMW